MGILSEERKRSVRFFFHLFFLFFSFFDVPLKMKVQHVMMILIGLLVIGSDAVGYYRPCSSQSDCDVGLVCRIPDEYMMKEKYCLLKRGVQCAFDTQRCGKTSPTGALNAKKVFRIIILAKEPEA